MDQIKTNNIAYAKLLNKCWDDPAYLEKFRADPAAALKEHGIPTPPNARYHIVDPKDMKPSTNEDVYLYYVDKPQITSLSDAALTKVAGGEELDKYIPDPPDPEPSESVAVNVTDAVSWVNAVTIATDVFAVLAIAIAAALVLGEADGQQ